MLQFWVSVAAVPISAIIAVVAIIVNARTNARNRRVRAAFDLFNTYYGDEEFGKRRIDLWHTLKELNAARDTNWNFQEWMSSLGTQTPIISKDMFATLNRIIAFYWGLRCMIERKEVDTELVANGFGFNYSSSWDPYRERFYQCAPAAMKGFFEPVPFLRDS
jgi:hypothetical protein